VDDARFGVPPLNTALPIDLHMHSTASDGVLPPAGVVRRASELGLGAIALTDHDTVDGVAEALAEGERRSVRVVSGCEFSTAAPWGEMHVLGYFLPADDPTLNGFLVRRREDRVRRAREMVQGLQAWGVDVSFDHVVAEAGNAAIGRPHLARVLVRLGKVTSVENAFREWLGRGRPAYVEKALPTFRDVADLVHSVGGIVSAAHLKERGTRINLTAFRDEGLDAVETRHPSHSGDTRARLTALAAALGLLRTGGSDWHGEENGEGGHAMLGSQAVPSEWLESLDQSLLERRASG
jgi:predicted metal-dependent phosphoesterase TrpH